MESINSHQQVLYEKYEKNTIAQDLQHDRKVLERYRGQDKLRILDIGGASGSFALALSDFFENQAEIYVLDNSEYATWQDDAYRRKMHFIHDSVENLSAVFQNEPPFDLIFANRVFHHFVRKSWRKTLKGMDDVLAQIRQLLAENGTLCIKEHFYNGMVSDRSASFMIFLMTTCRIPGIAKFMQKNGAHSAGVGVCFQSEQMWIKRLEKNGFLIEEIDREPYKRLIPKKRYALLCREYSLENCMYIKKA